LDFIKERRVGDDYAMNYDPGLISGFEQLVTHAEMCDFPVDSDEKLIDMVYRHMIIAYATQQRLPASERMTNWFSKHMDMLQPEFIASYKMMALSEEFQPKGVEKAVYENYTKVPPAPKYDRPTVDPRIPAAQIAVHNEFPEFTVPPFVGFSQTYDGVDLRFVTAQDPQAIKEATLKFNNYGGDYSTINYNDLHLSTLEIISHIGDGFDPELVEVCLDIGTIREALDKETSLGYLPASFYDNIDGVDVEVPAPKKRDALDASQDAFQIFLLRVSDYITGKLLELPHPGPLYESHKLELIAHLEFFDQRPDYMDADEAAKAGMKQRLFYMSATLALMIDNAIFKPLLLRARYWLSAIGIKVTEGGLLEMWDIVMGKRTSPLKQRWRRVKRFLWHYHGVDIGDRKFGEGDWSSYDTTLAAMVMASALSAAFAAYSEHSDPLVRLLAVVAHGQNITKIMWMYLADQFFRVDGRMFSGVLITSTIDTVYQMVLYIYYMKRLMRKFPDDVPLREMLSSWMFIMFFYGDDHVASWPVLMENYKLFEDAEDPLDDFVKLCVREFGMMYKTKAAARYDEGDVIGEIYFSTDNPKRIPLEIEDLTLYGMTFLKYSVVQVYIDGEPFLEPIPMKHPKDTPVKLGWSVSASKNHNLELAKVIALAYLNTNPELHVMLKAYYDALVVGGAQLSDEIVENFLSRPEGLSMYLLADAFKDSKTFEFPSLISNYMKQYTGYAERSGFNPLSSSGAIIPWEEKIKMWRADDYTGSSIPENFL